MYKRQESFNQIIEDMKSFAELAENTMEKANSQAESLEPVSYTHLDVYKRQSTGNRNRASEEYRVCFAVHAAGWLRFRQHTFWNIQFF